MKGLAQPRHVGLNAVSGACGRLLAPELIDQDVPGHNFIGAQQQDGQQRALLGPAERERSPVLPDLQRAK